MKPYYVFDEKQFAENVNKIKKAFKSVYGNFHIGYSYKTNSFDVFCKTIRDMGEFAEVVSPTEFDLAADKYDVRDDRIIYNGLFEDFGSKIYLGTHGGIVNVDNVQQLLWFEQYAKSYKTQLELGVRLNFDIGNGIISRFGVDVLGEDYDTLLAIKKRGYIRFKSVHCHYTKARSLKHFENRINGMIKYANELGADIIDIGGNMFGEMDEAFKSQFPCEVPTFAEYAEVIAGAMKKAYPDESKMLIIECGTPLVANAMHLACHVMSVKRINGQTFIDIDAKREDVGAACSNADPVVECYGKKQSLNADSIICACSCVEFDRIVRHYKGFAGVGDTLLFKNIGAYSLCMNNDFISPKIDTFISIDEFKKRVSNKQEL